jgi:hypothetical protein
MEAVSTRTRLGTAHLYAFMKQMFAVSAVNVE